MLRTLISTSRIVSTSTRVLRLSSRMSIETSSSSVSTAEFGTAAASFDPEAKLAELHYKLPTPSKSVANYVMCKRVGNILYTGKLSCTEDNERIIVNESHTNMGL